MRWRSLPAQGPRGWLLALACLCLLPALSGCGQSTAPTPPAEIAGPPAPADLTSHAAVAFRGTVIAVEAVPAPPDGVATIRVRFQVEEAFRGVNAGQVFTLTEWQGLWTSGDRYRVGEPLLLYLFAPAAASGLASPVNGNAGVLWLQPAAVSPDESDLHPGPQAETSLPPGRAAVAK